MTFEHSSDSVEHYTPPAIVEAARLTMGGIDLDPASCAEANEVVKAPWFFSREGLDREWRSRVKPNDGPRRVFLNPPGGKVGKRSSAVVWWEKLINEWLDGNVSQAVYVCFNLEVLNTTQASPSPCLDFPICYFRSRPRFWPPGTPPELRGKSGSPKYPGCAVYVPSAGAKWTGSDRGWHAGFARAFAPLGRVVIPA
jgi:hypothetical protein